MQAMTEMRNLLSKTILLAALFAAVSCGKEADVKLPSLVSDGMVLQRDVPSTCTRVSTRPNSVRT